MPDNEVGPWARDKLDRLQRYLQAYTTIMSRQKWCEGFAYIDAFAGPGLHEVRARKRQPTQFQQAMLEVGN